MYKIYTFPDASLKSVHINIFQIENLPWQWYKMSYNVESVWSQNIFIDSLPLKEYVCTLG